MPAEELILVVVVTMFMGLTIVAANYADRNRRARYAIGVSIVFGTINLLLVLNGLLTLLSAYSDASDRDDPISKPAAWGGLVASLVVVVLATALLIGPVRRILARLFPRVSTDSDRMQATGLSIESLAGLAARPAPPGEPLFPQMLDYYTTVTSPEASLTGGSVAGREPWGTREDLPVARLGAAYRVRGFDAASTVHMSALILVVYMLGSQLISFVVDGGLQGVAQSIEDQGLNGWDLLVNSAPFVVLSFLGVGLGVRRSWSQTLARLGLDRLTREGVFASMGVTIALLIGLVIVGMIWVALVPEDVYEDQTQASEALSQSVTSIGLAVLLAATAAVGEEIAFRGALQPVIGFWPTAAIFALTHTQYALTPAWLIIFGVAIAFGWVRKRYSTSVAILTHFWYNLIQLLLLFVVPEQATESILRLF